MFELKLRDAPKLPQNVERQIGNYVVGVRNAYTNSYSPDFPRGNVYIARLSGKTTIKKKWKPTFTQPFRIVEKTVPVEDFRFVAPEIGLLDHDAIERIKLSIAGRYGKVIQNGVLEKWLNPILDEYKVYSRKMRGE